MTYDKRTAKTVQVMQPVTGVVVVWTAFLQVGQPTVMGVALKKGGMGGPLPPTLGEDILNGVGGKGKGEQGNKQRGNKGSNKKGN